MPRLVLVSTEQVVLGDRPLVDADESWPYPARWPGPYARTKAEAEQLVLAASTPELATVAVRPRLVWGRGDTDAAAGAGGRGPVRPAALGRRRRAT